MPPEKNPPAGCGFLLWTCLATCVLLLVNAGIVGSLYSFLAPIGPRILRHPRALQFLLFAGPVLLLFFEWWLVDFLVDRGARFWPPRRPADRDDETRRS